MSKPLARLGAGRLSMDGERPLCEGSGRCEAPQGASGVCNCEHCGTELDEGAVAGCWFTWDRPPQNAVCQTHDSMECVAPGEPGPTGVPG